MRKLTFVYFQVTITGYFQCHYSLNTSSARKE